jgi:hypothetical protein
MGGVVITVDSGKDRAAEAGAFGADGAAEEVGGGLLPDGRGQSCRAGVGDGPLGAVGIDAIVVVLGRPSGAGDALEEGKQKECPLRPVGSSRGCARKNGCYATQCP